MVRIIKFSNKSHQKTWTKEELATVRTMFEEGYTDEQIGERLGRTALAVGLKRSFFRLRKPMSPSTKFEINDAMADYYPNWYKEHLKAKWREQYTKS